MINAQHVAALLQNRYPDLEKVSQGVFRGVDRYGARDYAVRYFDLNDQLTKTVDSLRNYQEEVLAPLYFSNDVATDLRWNHYLYFITSEEQAQKKEFSRIKAKVEADREYARKQVIREEDVVDLLANHQVPETPTSLPIDLATTWSTTLEQHGLAFVLDSDISVPDVVRRILAGAKKKASHSLSPVSLCDSEKAATSHFIKHLSIKGFRPHPEEKSHPLGRVNLIVGSNGVGKTSLLEAIEFAYCGRNRRSSNLLKNTSVTAELVGTEHKLSSTTDTAQLRARHSNWYAKTELRTVTIQDSFGKFNFLNTDAAVALSVSTSSTQIGEDVTRLVLGAAAEALADRLRRVLKQLQDELKDQRRDKENQEQLMKAALTRLEAIKSAPKLSDSLFLELLTALNGLQWSHTPDDKSQLDILRKHLQEASSAITIVRQSPIDVLHAEPDSVQQFLTTLHDGVRKAVSLDKRAKSVRLTEANARRDAQKTSDLSIAVDALLPYARANFPQLLKKESDCRDRVQKQAARLSPVSNLGDMGAIHAFLGMPLSEAIYVVETKARESQRLLDATTTAMQALEKTQNTMAVLKQRLFGTAQEIVRNSANPDHCPLCRTKFEEGQLLVQMMAAAETSTSDQSIRLQKDVSTASETIAETQAILAILHPLHAFAADHASTLTVTRTLEQITEARDTLNRDEQELEALQTQLQQLKSAGFSSQDLKSKLLAASMSELPSQEDLQRVHAKQRELLETLQNTEKNAKQESESIRLECDSMATSLSIEVFGDTDLLAQSIKEMTSRTEAAIGARQTLASILTIKANQNPDEISLDIKTIQKLVTQVTTTVAQEKSNDKALNEETTTLEQISKKIEQIGTRVTHASDAEKVLDTLSKQSSGGELENKILTENAAEIARTFASIHMPNEFEIQVNQGKLVIVRKSNNVEVQLEHMSTGQRAAFALSLFLAMNARLHSGPPVLLFDDPVAHIDDINMLSFLDHLRQLAIKGSRQIFFATADAKLAGLFRHKFRFLGDEFKELRLSRTL